MEVTWSDLEAKALELAGHGRRLFYQWPPIAIGMLATTRADGGPRVHPVCPAIVDGALWVFVGGRSPKRADLDRDGRYSLHSMPAPADDESWYCTGRAHTVTDPATRARIEAGVHHTIKPDEALYELRISAVLHTRWENARTPQIFPVYARWSAKDAP